MRCRAAHRGRGLTGCRGSSEALRTPALGPWTASAYPTLQEVKVFPRDVNLEKLRSRALRHRRGPSVIPNEKWRDPQVPFLSLPPES